jgi:hypothetical protein
MTRLILHVRKIACVSSKLLWTSKVWLVYLGREIFAARDVRKVCSDATIVLGFSVDLLGSRCRTGFSE